MLKFSNVSLYVCLVDLTVFVFILWSVVMYLMNSEEFAIPEL